MERKSFLRLLPGLVTIPVITPIVSCNSARSNHQAADISGQSQATEDIQIGDTCESCEEMYEGMPAIETIKSSLTIALPGEPGERMLIDGIVYQRDGKTPAPNIILYAWHTDAKGLYSKSEFQQHGRRHGRLRGWARTDENGKFSVSSIRPASYPSNNIPAHIHMLVKEPGKTLYYIDEVWFDDDPLVTPTLRKNASKRGGNLIIHLTKEAGVWRGSLPITLGLNIPNYK